MLLVNRLEHTNVLGVLAGPLDEISKLAAAAGEFSQENTLLRSELSRNWQRSCSTIHVAAREGSVSRERPNFRVAL